MSAGPGVTPMIDVRDLRKVYRRDSQEITVLDGIALQVSQGDFVALMGPSGSGKTTLLNLIAGIDRPTSGSVVVAGTDVGGLSESALARWRSQSSGWPSRGRSWPTPRFSWPTSPREISMRRVPRMSCP